MAQLVNVLFGDSWWLQFSFVSSLILMVDSAVAGRDNEKRKSDDQHSAE